MNIEFSKVVNFDGNPFVGNTFLDVWNKHFNKGREQRGFNGLHSLRFLKLKTDIYLNVGANKTYGLSYDIDRKCFTQLDKVLLIKDVHTFFNDKTDLNDNLKRLILRRYPGFLADLREFKDTNEYLKTRFSKNRIRRLHSCRRRLELCYDVEYKFYNSFISLDEHNNIFSKFRELLVKRYSEKNINNVFLRKNHWTFQRELSYKLINESKASLFVIYANGEPINICLNYLTDYAVILGMIVFDTDFERFNIGHLSINKQMHHYYMKGTRIIDFSQSFYNYKRKICNMEYSFEYHIIYNNKILKHNILAFFVYFFYQIVTLKYHLFKKISNHARFIKSKIIRTEINKYDFCFFDVNEINLLKKNKDMQLLKQIPKNLKKPINYFIFKYSIKYTDIKVYQFVEQNNSYLLADKSNNKIGVALKF